jgi:hypothetical protein
MVAVDHEFSFSESRFIVLERGKGEYPESTEGSGGHGKIKLFRTK